MVSNCSSWPKPVKRFKPVKSTSDRALTAWTSSNILAGSDTTAIFLRTLFHRLLAHPSTLASLRTELDAAASAGRLSIPATWKESLDLPYLDACIKEAGRVHPPFGLPLERVVPPDGATICGEYLPPGTIVGISAWVAHHDRETFGEDADTWRPERWLVEAETRKRMELRLLTVRSPSPIFSMPQLMSCAPFSLVPATEHVSERTSPSWRSISSFQQFCKYTT